MDVGALKVAGQVAGVGGIALMVFLFIFRALLAKDIFPKLSQAQGFRTIRLLMILTALVTLSGLAAWAFASRGQSAPRRVLRVSLSEVENDWDGREFAAMDFEDDLGRGVSAMSIDRAARWVVEELVRTNRIARHDFVTATISVPADLRDEKIAVDVTPSVPFKTFLWEKGGGGGKIRTDIEWTDAPRGRMLEAKGIEVRPDGYESVGVEIDFKATNAAAKTHVLKCLRRTPVVAMKDGGASVEPAADRLTTQLRLSNELRVESPEQLAARRSAVGAAVTGNAPMAQLDLRPQIGYEFLVTCNVRTKAGD